MRPAPQQAGGGSNRRRMDGDAGGVGFTEFICTNDTGVYTPSIDEVSVMFMTVSMPGFVTDTPGGTVTWGWNKTDMSAGGVYNFDAPVHLIQSGRSDDPVVRNPAQITTQADLVARMSRFSSWHTVNATSSLMGCTSMQEYSSGNGSYVCGPSTLDITVADPGRNATYVASISFQIFTAMSQFIGGNYTRGLLDLKADVVPGMPNCSMVVRFELSNPMGTNADFIELESRNIHQEDRLDGARYLNDSGYDTRFPGQGWVFSSDGCTDDDGCSCKDGRENCWSQPGYTSSFSAWMQPGEVGAFLKEKIYNSSMLYKGDILGAWGGLENRTRGAQLLNKMYCESFGTLYTNHLRQYTKYFGSLMYRQGFIKEKPINIDTELWAAITGEDGRR